MPLNERTNTWGDVQPTEYIGPAEPQGGHILGALASLLGLGEWQRGERAGVPGSAPGVGYGAIDDILGWLDPPAKATAALPLAGGMLKFAKKEYPNALLHRTFSHPREVDYIMDILAGKRPGSQAPASVISPGYTSVFGGGTPGHAGVLFNVEDPANLKHLGSSDLYSHFSERRPEPIQSELEGLLQELFYPKRRLNEIDEKRLLNRVVEIEATPTYREWTPTRATIDKNIDDPLERLVERQMAEAKANTRRPEILHHNEAIYNIQDPNELAGVRMPTGNAPLREALQKLINEYGLPLYELPQPKTRDEQIEQMKNFWTGEWR